MRNKTVIYKVVAYERWSHTEVVAMRDRVDCAMIFLQDTLFDLFFILYGEPTCSLTPCTTVVLLQSFVTRSVRIFVNANVAGRLCKVLLNSFSDIHFKRPLFEHVTYRNLTSKNIQTKATISYYS